MQVGRGRSHAAGADPGVLLLGAGRFQGWQQPQLAQGGDLVRDLHHGVQRKVDLLFGVGLAHALEKVHELKVVEATTSDAAARALTHMFEDSGTQEIKKKGTISRTCRQSAPSCPTARPLLPR